LMLSFGRSGSSWGKMTQAGSSCGKKVITPYLQLTPFVPQKGKNYLELF